MKNEAVEELEISGIDHDDRIDLRVKNEVAEEVGNSRDNLEHEALSPK